MKQSRPLAATHFSFQQIQYSSGKAHFQSLPKFARLAPPGNFIVPWFPQNGKGRPALACVAVGGDAVAGVVANSFLRLQGMRPLM